MLGSHRARSDGGGEEVPSGRIRRLKADAVAPAARAGRPFVCQGWRRGV